MDTLNLAIWLALSIVAVVLVGLSGALWRAFRARRQSEVIDYDPWRAKRGSTHSPWIGR